MKNKWFFVLLGLFLAAVVLSLLLLRQEEKIAPVLKPAEAPEGNAEAILPPRAYLPPAAPERRRKLPEIKGITIIKVPEVPAERDLRIPKTEAPRSVSSNNNISGTASSGNVEEAENILPAGVTKDNKHPSTKETAEMNSSGIVLY
ncbi:MAG: hypothetical protein PHQ84_04210 [Candidatus Omnitrophica bacterium]|jgi:hypothetical protein|nr:hypothetical protein [Candidatus Omnitrophota bacterium]MDD3274228.1 hypothetical protein [Candidatus Omnitrophota bacterium]MDD5078191.1 hypothetical protein [Candidatus Omnitrophota bacterium]